MITRVPTPGDIDARHDFDFLFGAWRVHNRRLRDPLSGSDEWYEFEATSTERPLLDGLANLEQFDAPDTPNGPLHAIAVRLFDVTSCQWSIYWAKSGDGSFGLPMVGWFKDGVGLFFDREEYQGRQIDVRFTWTHQGTSTCRFEQAFSLDEGTTWEPNWIMDFSRIGE